MRYWNGVALFSIFGLSLIATGCDTSTESGQLEDVNWKLTRLSGMSLAADSENGPGLTFRSADGQMAGSTGCNQIGGSYIVDGESINLGQIRTTLIGGREDPKRQIRDEQIGCLTGCGQEAGDIAGSKS